MYYSLSSLLKYVTSLNLNFYLKVLHNVNKLHIKSFLQVFYKYFSQEDPTQNYGPHLHTFSLTNQQAKTIYTSIKNRKLRTQKNLRKQTVTDKCLVYFSSALTFWIVLSQYNTRFSIFICIKIYILYTGS